MPNREAGPSGARILPRKPIDEVRSSVKDALSQLYESCSSDESIEREKAEREGLSPLETAILNAEFVMNVIGPIVNKYGRRVAMPSVTMTRSSYTRNQSESVRYEVTDDGGVLVINRSEKESIRISKKKRKKIADKMQTESDKSAEVRSVIDAFGSLSKADLVNSFSGRFLI
jgi:biopolymer transport protein ExbD